MSRSLRYAAVTTLAAAVLALAACGSSGGSNSSSSGGGGSNDRSYGGGGATTAAAAPATSAAASATSAAAGGGAAAAGNGAVSIKGFAFNPGDVTVAKGTTVTWTNNDSATHKIKSGDGSFNSDNLANGDTFQHTFDTAGTFDYICSIHPSMKGKVTVTG
jgi:plastocyanin